MTLDYLKSYTKQMMKAYPQHADEILEAYELALHEIEDGNSEPNEISLAINEIQTIIEDE